MLMKVDYGKDGCSQIGVEVGNSVNASELGYKLYLNISGVIFHVVSKLPSYSRNL